MDDAAVTTLVIALYTAAGRDYGDVTEQVYRKALEKVDDETGLEAMDALLRHVSWEKPPSPALVLNQVASILRYRREATPAIEEATGPPASREASLEWVWRIKAAHGPSKMTDSLEKIAQRQPEAP